MEPKVSKRLQNKPKPYFGKPPIPKRAKSDSNGSNLFNKLDFTSIVTLRSSLRVSKLAELQSKAKEEHDECKVVDDNDLEVAKLIRMKVGDDVNRVPVLNEEPKQHLIQRLRSLAQSGLYHKVNLDVGQESVFNPCLVCEDISNGLEALKIPVFNEYDDPPIPPTGFTYIKSMQVAENVKVPTSTNGCSCEGSCRNPRTCSCAKLNCRSFPFAIKDGGRLVEPRDVVFECDSSCGCGPKCGNKISQRDIKYHLEVYRTPNKGWGVRTRDFIPSGAPVCEYIGTLRRCDGVDNGSDNDYIFEIDCIQTINHEDGRQKRLGNVLLPINNGVDEKRDDDETMREEPEFCIDGGSYGNVARFINHSCAGNLFVQCFSSSHRDLKQARLVFVASMHIYAYEELTYDYGYRPDSVVGPDGKIKQLLCHCGLSNCRERLY